MERWRGTSAAPSGWGRCVVTIGVFDGVHRGHQVIIGAAVARARAAGQPAVLLTFDPHPAEVVRPGTHPAVLTGQRRKAELVAALGIDVFCVQPFTPEFARLSPAEFVHGTLADPLHASRVVVGENFHFGRKAAGDVDTLAAIGATVGFAVEGLGLVDDGAGDGADGRTATRYSSTAIRGLVAAGDVAAARGLLGRPHRVEGVVVRGDRRGRELGYPTANLEPLAHSAVPADGVYAGRLVRADGSVLGAAVSIGTNPTFAGTERRVEAFALDFDGDLYGEHVGLEFLARLRPTLSFDGIEPLLVAMATDVATTRELLAAEG